MENSKQYLSFPHGRKIPIPLDKLFTTDEQAEIDKWEEEKRKTSRKLLHEYRTIEKFKAAQKQKPE